ncbi:hypothetical protein HPP92_028316 [Vanilla planifolia]|uniref:Uncharacterized protein n=1 Tax=Vanilla planifolia TaxID=51239 RepID=A0A835U608_VANPL|nr:hypothetical protein HPP92_028316 [Vanilla planifolia]KAG0447520.1 hypothetical protein HPP92_028286 [Vanilla planifolia]
MAECKEAESIIYQEQSLSHSESHPSETLPSNQVLCSEKEVDIKQLQDKVIKNFTAKVEEDGYRGKTLESQAHTSPLRLSESEYVLENAADPSSALHGPPSHDLSYVSTKEPCNVLPHHENENAVQGSMVAVSTVLDVSLFSSGKVHGSSSPNHVSISKKEDVIQQHQDGCSIDVPIVRTSKAHLFDKSTVAEVATLQNELQSMSRPDSGDVSNGPRIMYASK